MSRSDRIAGNEPLLLSAVAAAEHILETYDVDVFAAEYDSLEERVSQALIGCHMSLDMPLALGLADEMVRLLMTDGRFAAEWAHVSGLVGREPLDLLSSVPWDMKPELVLAHAALSGWDVDEPGLECEYGERLDGARAAWAAGRYDYDLREVDVDRHPSWEGGVEDEVDFARDC